MKKIWLIFLLLPLAGLAQQTNEMIFQVVEQNPEFVGGTDSLLRFIKHHLRYPEAAKRAEIKGKVFLSFVVESDGTITNLEILRGLGFGCDEEALRIMSIMPKWKPGKQSGRAVRVRYHLPIVFSLE